MIDLKRRRAKRNIPGLLYLWREAERRGVSANRLIFAPRVKVEEYLARLPLAGLLGCRSW
jgi:hypothetical protein